ncbi:hypothetical protein PTO0075 [Picrophilus oshimae DSM 9789]|uniref:YgjP-like metallopeptidase domain-containing protein n=2 Tax=Picrophilus oshimae TaxID=46632 RepID=Q6L2Z1_PICTO|nr:hypothetical protein PTO0075 [Picrophilus oshimae DSM 9789]
MKNINYNGINFNVVIKGIKNPRIEIGEDLKIIINSEENAVSFIKNNYEWILKKYDFIKKCSDEAKNILNNNLIIMNENFEFGDTKYINFENKIINKNINNVVFKKIIIKKLSEKIENKLNYYKNKYDFDYNKIVIRNQKTKWGSCSSENNLNFNIRIAFIPEILFNYILFHEIVHTRIKNHNKMFYSYISNEFNNYKKLNDELYIYWFYSNMIMEMFNIKNF